MLPIKKMSLPNRKNIGVAYFAITIALVATIMASWWCWQSQNVGNHPTETLHDICLAIWAVSGALLALSQIVFIGVAWRMKDGAVAKTDLASGAPLGEAPASVMKITIIVSGVVIVFVIALFLFALSSMPS
jgi:hypothetical protein